MSSLKQLALDLLYHCNAAGDWEPDVLDKSVQNLLEVVSDHPDYRGAFSPEIAYSLLVMRLARSELQAKATFTDDDADQFLADLRANLSANVAEHWIVVPLRNARLNTTVRFQDFVFIAGSREEKIDTVRHLSRISEEESIFRATHTESTRSPGFFEHPLLAIRVAHQTEHVNSVAQRYALWAICSLQALFWGYVYPEEKALGLLMRRECNHLAIHAEDSWRFGHRPLNCRAECRFGLGWLHKRANQRRFVDLFHNIVAPPSMDHLTYRFFRALRFFGKAVNAEESKEAFEGIGITLLFLMIAAETVLLDGDFEKRTRLTVLLPRLANLPGYTRAECASAIDQVYRFRSDFVHSATDTYPDWNEDFSEGETSRNARIVERMVARLLCDAPKHIEKMLERANQDRTRINSEWFKFLRNQWKRTIGLH